MADFFYWSGDDACTDEPEWMTAAIADGRVKVEAGGTEDVFLVINGRPFPRQSVITRRDVEGAAAPS